MVSTKVNKFSRNSKLGQRGEVDPPHSYELDLVSSDYYYLFFLGHSGYYSSEMVSTKVNKFNSNSKFDQRQFSFFN
jgi:hypothetical protein